MTIDQLQTNEPRLGNYQTYTQWRIAWDKWYTDLQIALQT